MTLDLGFSEISCLIWTVEITISFLSHCTEVGFTSFPSDGFTIAKVGKILKGSLDLTSSPSPSMNIQIIGKEFTCGVKAKHCCNVLHLYLKQTFPPIICIFTEGEDGGIESRLPFKIFSTLSRYILSSLKLWDNYHKNEPIAEI